jgi:N,N'-diacetyllegionaminate synthase
VKKVLIIAEAGVNHNGDFELAKEMILAAKEAGADYVKFQTGIPELVISKFAPKAEYQKVTTGSAESQLEMCKKLQLSYDDFGKLKEYCDETGIAFLSTPFELVSIEMLAKLDMDYFKIPSGEITNKPYLQSIARKKKPVIISTGMALMDEIEAALDVMTEQGLTRDQITVLHCNTEYPTPMEDVNLTAMLAIGRELKVKVGYSDHTNGIEVPIAAVALGATVIEKHFTLDKNMEGPDHKASLEPHELKAMVDAIRNIEKAVGGSGRKEVSASERKNLAIARKSIVAKIKIRKGEPFTEANITVKRPGTGLSPMLWDEVVGKKAPRDFEEDEIIVLK